MRESGGCGFTEPRTLNPPAPPGPEPEDLPVGAGSRRRVAAGRIGLRPRDFWDGRVRAAHEPPPVYAAGLNPLRSLPRRPLDLDTTTLAPSSARKADRGARGFSFGAARVGTGSRV